MARRPIIRLCVGSKLLRGLPRDVDKIVDVGFQEFNTLQQNATRSRHLLETKRAENGRLCAMAGIRLGRRGRSAVRIHLGVPTNIKES